MSHKRKTTKKEKKYEQETKETIKKKQRILSIKTLVFKKKHSKALQEVLLYLKDYPGDSYGLFQYGSILFDIQQLEKAKEIFLKIIEEGLDSQYAAMYKMGVISLIENNIKQAEDYFKNNIESSPFDETYSYIELARMKAFAGYNEKSLEILEQAKNQNDPKLLIEKARVLDVLKKSDLAYEIINKYPFDTDNTHRDAYIIKAHIEENLGMVTEARDTYQKALKGPRDNTYYRALAGLAKYYYLLKDYEYSLKLCSEIIRKHNSQVLGDVYILLGDIYREIGDDQRARESYEQSTKYQHLVDKIGYFKIAQLELYRNNDEEAERYFKRIKPRNIYNKNGIQLLGLAIIEFRRKNDKKSRNLLNQIDIKYVDDEYKKDYTILKAYLDLKESEDLIDDSYTMSQIRDYSVARLINHINKKHASDFEQLQFNANINLTELVLQAPELLENATMIKSAISKVYQVEYPNIGTVNGENTDILRIVTLPEDNKILTMYPYKAGFVKRKKNKETKEDTLQIQKFYARYGKK